MLYTIIFANGSFNNGPAVQAALAVTHSRCVIAADGGCIWAHRLDIVPDVIIGDMDSAPEDIVTDLEKKGSKIIRYPVAKDETDLELALLEAFNRKSDVIRIIGAVGGRLDQTLANVYLLALPALRHIDVKLVSGRETTWLAYPGQVQIEGQKGDTVSLVPIAGEAAGIATENMQYPLRGETLTFGPARGISNVMMHDKASFTFERGLLLVIHTVGRA